MKDTNASIVCLLRIRNKICIISGIWYEMCCIALVLLVWLHHHLQMFI